MQVIHGVPPGQAPDIVRFVSASIPSLARSSLSTPRRRALTVPAWPAA